jgi:diguanylate cyclase (GGDEF)-like protein
VTMTLNQSEAIDLILEQLALVVPYDSASVLLHLKDKLLIVGGHGFKNISSVLGMEFPLVRDNPGAIVFLDRKPSIIDDIPSKYPDFNQIPHSDKLVRSWLGVPLIIQDRTIGILSLDAHQFSNFNADHSRMVMAFADQVAIALENTRLYTDMVRSSNRFETLYRLSQVFSSTILSEEIYPAIHQAVTELMTTEFFSISLVDEDEKLIRDVYMMDRNELQEPSSRPIGAGLFSKVLADGKSRLYNTFDENQIAETGAVLIGSVEEEEISQSILIIPLKTGSKIIGVLSAQSYQPNAYSESDKETLELLAANVAIAIQNGQLFSEVQKNAITDPLTHLFNRRRFYEVAFQEFERSRRYNYPLSVIMLDIDRFKKVNDSYGHSVGDQVLQQLAEVCKIGLRQSDVIARYGGEEFAALLPETDADEAMLIAERLRVDVAKTPVHTHIGDIPITISLGVVTLDGTCKNLEDLLDRSDQAMYASKRAGRDQTKLWKPEYNLAPPGTGPLPRLW